MTSGLRSTENTCHIHEQSDVLFDSKTDPTLEKTGGEHGRAEIERVWVGLHRNKTRLLGNENKTSSDVPVRTGLDKTTGCCTVATDAL